MALSSISIKKDFSQRKIGLISARRLKRFASFSPADYTKIKNLVLTPQFFHIRRLIVPKVGVLAEIPFSDISEDVLSACVRPRWVSILLSRGYVLDLRRLKPEINRSWKAELLKRLRRGDDPVGKLLSAIDDKREYFSRLRQEPNVTALDVIRKVNEDKGELGFENAVLTYPNPDGSGRWVRSSSASRPKIGDSGYSERSGGKIPMHTIKSIIEHPGDQIVFAVDIARGKEHTFSDQGLAISPIRDKDLEHYDGPTEMIFVRIKTSQGTRAVFHFHNRRFIDDKAGSSAEQYLLPNNRTERQMALTALDLYFRSVIFAIDSLQQRDGLNMIEQGKVGITNVLSSPLANRLDRYLPDSHLIWIRRKNLEGKIFKLSMEFLRRPYVPLQAKSNEIVNDMFTVFAQAWEPVAGQKLDPAVFKKYIFEKYWKRAEKLIILRNEENDVVGFASLTREIVNGKYVFCLAGTVLHPLVQGMRLSVDINKILLTEAWRQNAHLSGGEITLVTRTASPRVVGSLLPLEGLTPNPLAGRGDKADPAMINIAEELTSRWTPEVEFDRTVSVARGALTKGVGGLVYQPEELQPHRNQEVNKFCQDNLHYQDGDLFVFVGKFSRAVMLKILLKKLVRGFGEWWRRWGLTRSRRRIH